MEVETKRCVRCRVKRPLTAFRTRVDVEEPRIRNECRECENRDKRKRRGVQKPAHEAAAPAKTSLPDSHIYVITWAQNATAVHTGFLASLQQYCKERGAELIVIPGRYRNPTSLWSAKDAADDWWAAGLAPYLFSGRKTLGQHLTVFGDISIQPTATRPLTGFEVFAGPCSAIFGHPKLQLRTIPTAKRRYPRIFTTTGAVTLPNYTKTKAGKKGEGHHVFGATVVEKGEKLFHLRQINATEDGCFIDLDRHYTPTGSKPAEPALALVPGDIHVEMADQEVMEATFWAPDSIVQTLKPRELVLHDVLHFQRRNHHLNKDVLDRYARRLGAAPDDVRGEVQEASEFLDAMADLVEQVRVVASNHDEAYDRWLNEADPRHDPVNALFFHQSWSRKLLAFHEDGHWTPAFALYHQAVGTAKNVRFLSRNVEEKIGGIQIGFHGDNGPNGSKGSIDGYARLGVKSIIGHSHSPGILDGCTQVGVTGALDQGYNALPSGWMHTHCVIYANKKRCLLHIIDGTWRR